MAAKLVIGRAVWNTLIGQLRSRGAGVRESGAFLLSHCGGSRVSRFVCYDELCPDCLDSGYIRFAGAGYVKLARICQNGGFRVTADVHTHPGGWTKQSESDKAHPMMERAGQISLIVPNYARGNSWNLAGVGAYEYLGNGNWRDCSSTIKVTWLW
jgi:hypothetical protein